MATRFLYKALATAALGITLSLPLAETSIASPARSNTAEAAQLDVPAAPSDIRTTTRTIRKGGRDRNYTYTTVTWSDNSDNEDGFIFEVWHRTHSGEWVLVRTGRTPANVNGFEVGGRPGGDYRFRAKAFNASGESAWSDWGH